MARQIASVRLPIEARKFSVGQSNPTFLLTDAGYGATARSLAGRASQEPGANVATACEASERPHTAASAT